MTYYGGVSDGVLKISDRKRFDSEIKMFEGKRVEISIKKSKKTRSNPQNSYYWGVVIPCVLNGLTDLGNAGLTNDIVHSFLKDRFIQEGAEIIIPKTAEVIKMKTTTTLSTTQMMGYIADIQQFSAEILGVVIPDPTPIWNLNEETE